MSADPSGSGTPPAGPRTTRDIAAQVRRSRVSRLATIWLAVALVEYGSWRLFLSNAFYRDFFMPIAIVVVIAGLAASWRTLMRRDGDRRAGDRRGWVRRGASPPVAPAPREPQVPPSPERVRTPASRE